MNKKIITSIILVIILLGVSITSIAAEYTMEWHEGMTNIWGDDPQEFVDSGLDVDDIVKLSLNEIGSGSSVTKDPTAENLEKYNKSQLTVFCIEHGQYMNYNYTPYDVVGKAEIKGSEARISAEKGSWSYWVDDEINAKIAYVLSRNSRDTKLIVQNALWGFFKTFASDVCSKSGVDFSFLYQGTRSI